MYNFTVGCAVPAPFRISQSDLDVNRHASPLRKWEIIFERWY